MTESNATDLAAIAANALSPDALAALSAQLTAPLRSELASQNETIAALRGAMSNGDDHVRDALIRFCSDRGIENDSLNDLFAELNLDPIEVEFEVQVKVTAIQYVTVTVNAVDAQTAENLVNDGDDAVRVLVENEISSYDWENEEYEATNVTAV